MTYEAIIKVNVSDPPEKRAREIAEGINYACALLMDEYKWTAYAVVDVLDRAEDDAYEREAEDGR